MQSMHESRSRFTNFFDLKVQFEQPAKGQTNAQTATGRILLLRTRE